MDNFSCMHFVCASLGCSERALMWDGVLCILFPVHIFSISLYYFVEMTLKVLPQQIEPKPSHGNFSFLMKAENGYKLKSI